MERLSIVFNNLAILLEGSSNKVRKIEYLYKRDLRFRLLMQASIIVLSYIALSAVENRMHPDCTDQRPFISSLESRGQESGVYRLFD